MRHSRPILLVTLLLSTAACVGDTQCGAGTEAVGGQCRAIASDGGQDTTLDPVKGLDGSPTDSTGPDANLPPAAERDAGNRGDAALADAGEPSDAGALDACVATREVCNGLDDDCDGDIDDGVLKFYYVDRDGDGYGGGQGVLACSPPSGDYAERGNDCDDECKTCNPGNDAESICDGKDDDCDSEVDEGVKGTYYPDADDDGFGASGPGVVACEAPAHHVKDSSNDCDDACATCNPSKLKDESCDGKDDDCSGAADEDATFSTYYRDCDEDGYAPNSAGSVLRCARPAAIADCGWTTRQPNSITTTDCNDGNGSVKPGQTAFASEKIPGAAAGNDFDYNCDGREEREPLLDECEPCKQGCFMWYTTGPSPNPACGERYDLVQSEDAKCTSFRVNPAWSTYPRGCK